MTTGYGSGLRRAAWVALVAVLPGLPLLLIGVTGVLLSPRRTARP